MESSPSATEQPQGFSRNDFGPNNPQPTTSNPPGFRPNNRFNWSARVRANLPHFKTTKGILSILAVVFGLIAVVLIFYAYLQATVLDIHRACSKGCIWWNIHDHPTCHRSKSNFCELDTYYKDRLCEKGRNVKACVNLYLVTVPLSLILITWYATFGNLLRRLLILRNRLHTRDFCCRLACRIGKYGDLLGAFLVIPSGLCLIGYFVQVTQEDLCGNANLKAEAIDYVINNGPKPNSSNQYELRQNSVEDSNKIDMVLANLTRQCPEMQEERYYHWYFLVAAIFAIITGIIYILIAALSIKESSHAVEPVMMVMGPNGPQQPPTSQAQTESATHL